MRTGIYDYGSDAAGTLELPLVEAQSKFVAASSVGVQVKESASPAPEKPSNELPRKRASGSE